MNTKTHINPNGSKVIVPACLSVNGSVFIGPFVRLGKGIVLDGNIHLSGKVILGDRTFFRTQPTGTIMVSAYAEIGESADFSSDSESTIFIGGKAELGEDVRLCASRGHDLYVLGNAVLGAEVQVFADIASVELDGNTCLRERTQFFASLFSRNRSRDAHAVVNTDASPLGSMRLVPRNAAA